MSNRINIKNANQWELGTVAAVSRVLSHEMGKVLLTNGTLAPGKGYAAGFTKVGRREIDAVCRQWLACSRDIERHDKGACTE